MTANRVKNGEVVYYRHPSLTTGKSWTTDINKSCISSRIGDDQNLEIEGKKSVITQLVIDPYLIEVTQKNGNIAPTRYRELIRAKGPTTDPKLKKNN